VSEEIEQRRFNSVDRDLTPPCSFRNSPLGMYVDYS